MLRRAQRGRECLHAAHENLLLLALRHGDGSLRGPLDGRGDAAIEQFKVALRLSPLDPRIFVVQNGLAYGHFFAGRNEEASTWAATVIVHQPNFLAGQRIMMACHAMSGRVEEARQACMLALQLDPTQRISGIKDRTPFRRAEDIERLAQAFRIAGMPE